MCRKGRDIMGYDLLSHENLHDDFLIDAWSIFCSFSMFFQSFSKSIV